MKLNLKFFGRLEELTGINQQTLEVPEGLTVESLKTMMNEKNSRWQSQTYLIAVNQSIRENGELRDGDEIAFLPPFAGG